MAIAFSWSQGAPELIASRASRKWRLVRANRDCPGLIVDFQFPLPGAEKMGLCTNSVNRRTAAKQNR
jgi:hypothetical protein